MGNEIRTITRMIGKDKAAAAGLAITGDDADDYISGYLELGWTIHSIHPIEMYNLDVVKKRKWWEFWKEDEVTHNYGLGIYTMWVLVR